MAKFEWYQAVKLMQQNLVRIEAGNSVGSGVRFAVPDKYEAQYNHCILTAHHVIKDILKDKLPLSIIPESDRKKKWTIEDWSIVHNQEHDHALVMFGCADCMPPFRPYKILEPKSHYVPGVEIGWLGYPNISGLNGVACFSHGYISAYLKKEEAYLVDGVSIHGMSGGPAFVCENDGTIVLAGVVTNYLANRRPDGKVLPGMAMFRTIQQIQKYYSNFK